MTTTPVPDRDRLVSLRDVLERALRAIDAELDETRPPTPPPEPIPTPAEDIAPIRGGRHHPAPAPAVRGNIRE